MSRTSLRASFFHRSASLTWANAKASFGTAARSAGRAGALPAGWAAAAAATTRVAMIVRLRFMREPRGYASGPVGRVVRRARAALVVRNRHAVILLDHQAKDLFA